MSFHRNAYNTLKIDQMQRKNAKTTRKSFLDRKWEEITAMTAIITKIFQNALLSHKIMLHYETICKTDLYTLAVRPVKLTCMPHLTVITKISIKLLKARRWSLYRLQSVQCSLKVLLTLYVLTLGRPKRLHIRDHVNSLWFANYFS